MMRAGSLGTWKRRGKWLALAGVVVAAFLYWRLSAPVVVQTTPVVSAYPSQSLSVLNAAGYVVAQRQAALSSKATGRLELLGVAEGAVVKKGQLVARLERREVAAQLDQARAQVAVAQAELQEAQQNFDRSEQLLQKNFIASSSHDAVIARLNRARASLAAAQAQAEVASANLAQTEIRAPFDAVVLTKNANEGDNITPFSSAADSKGAVVTIADMSTLEVETDVSESAVARLKLGQPAEIALDALPGERFAGAIVRMVPTIDRAKGTRLVKVKFDLIDERILPDMSAKVVFLERPLAQSERAAVIAVSPQAVVLREGVSVVYLLEGDRVREVALGVATAGASPGAQWVAAPSLVPGQRVVIRPGSLRDGQRVRPAAS